jgi:hypothetical protein
MEDIEYKKLQKSSYTSAALTLMGFGIIVGSLAFSSFQIKRKEIRINELTEIEEEIAQELEKKRQELTLVEARTEEAIHDFEMIFPLLNELGEGASQEQIAEIKAITDISAKTKNILAKNLLISLVRQLDKTKAAFERYVPLQALWEGNSAALSLLKARKYLLPDDLKKDADQLIEHYEAWLSVYTSVVGDKELTTETPFVFAGPNGCPFPREAERNLRERLESLLR